jgi:hypothetical protein
MRQTDNYGFNLPEGSDNYDKNDYNENFRLIDAKMKELADHAGGGGGTYGTLTAYTNNIYEASQDPNVDAWDKVIVAVTPSLMNRTITENGTYTASQEEPVSYDGYGTVIIDVKPAKVLISEFDFKSDSPWYDLVKKGNLGTLMHNGTATQGVGLEFTGRGQRVRTGTIFDFDAIYEMEVKFGTFNKETPPNTANNFLLCFSRNNYSAMLCFKNYNSETGLGDWWIHDQTGNNIYLDDVHEPYFFENKTLKIFFGAKLVDGELVRDLNKIYYYIDDVQLNTNGAMAAGDVDNSIGVVHLGDRQSATFQGAVFEGFKVYQYFNKYETPASLMMTAPGESKSLSETKSTDEKPAEELIDEEKETDTKEELKNESEVE